MALGLPLAALAAIPVVVVSFVVVLETPGPAWIRQRRVGRAGRELHVWKVRTMRADAERETGPVLARVGDERVTRVGLLQTMAYMRAASDERVQRYYGISAAEASSSGFAAFEPSGGLSAAGAAALLAIPIGDRYGMGAFVNYEQRLGDIKDSPLIEDDYIWRAGVIGVVRFNSGD